MGPSLTNSKPGSNLTHKRFSSSFSIPELWKLYEDSMKEFYRILDDKGILIFKAMDTVSGGVNYFSHYYIMKKAIEIGFYPKDLFILGKAMRIAKENNMDWVKIKAEATSGDYDHLLQTMMKYFDVE